MHDLHRRIRAAVAIGRWAGDPTPARDGIPSLAWIGHRLGELRDRQVAESLLREFAREAELRPVDPAFRRLSRQLRRESVALRRRIVRRVDVVALGRALRRNRPSRAYLRNGPPAAVAALLRHRLARAESRLRHDPSARNFHRFRKRLRELVLLSEHRATALGGRATPRQGAVRRRLRELGRLHDLHVLRVWLEDHAPARPGRRIARRVEREERQLRARLLSKLRSGPPR